MRWWTGLGLAVVTIGMLMQIIGWGMAYAVDRKQIVKFVVGAECITAVQVSEKSRLELPLDKAGNLIAGGPGTLYGVKVTYKAGCGRYEVTQ